LRLDTKRADLERPIRAKSRKRLLFGESGRKYRGMQIGILQVAEEERINADSKTERSCL
jgi:hypothetical protein